MKELETFVKRYLIAGDEELTLSELETSSAKRRQAAASTAARGILRAKRLKLPPAESIPQSLKSMIQSVRWETERNAIAAALEKTGWNRKAAARLLGVSYRTILYKIEQYEMSAPEPTFLFPGAGLTFLESEQRETEKQVESRNHHEWAERQDQRSRDGNYLQVRARTGLFASLDLFCSVAGTLGASGASGELHRPLHPRRPPAQMPIVHGTEAARRQLS